MQISKHKVVTMEYTLTDAEGSIIDESKGDEAFAYIQGIGSIISGLEKALEGKTVGESVQVSIAPEEAYGVRDDELMTEVPLDRFESPEMIEPGMQFHTQSPEGAVRVVTVVSVQDDVVTVDGNHPLAGVTLNFSVNIKDVRDATEEELEHGHAHGEGGHHH